MRMAKDLARRLEGKFYCGPCGPELEQRDEVYVQTSCTLCGTHTYTHALILNAVFHCLRGGTSFNIILLVCSK